MGVLAGNFYKATVTETGEIIFGIDVHGNQLDINRIIGKENGNGSLLLDVYDHGFPHTVLINDTYSNEYFFSRTNPINTQEEIGVGAYCAHLDSCRRKLLDQTNVGGLAAACFATRARYIEEVMNNMMANPRGDDGRFHHYKIAPSPSGTGVYVVCTATSHITADRNHIDPLGGFLEAIKVSPRIHPANLAIVLQQFYPDSFGKVPSFQQGIDSKGLYWGKERGMVLNRGYFCYEISRDGLDFIKDAKELSIQ